MSSSNRLSCRETAALTGLSEFSLARYRSLNRGPAFVRISRNRVEYLAESVQAWVEERTVRPAAKGAAA